MEKLEKAWEKARRARIVELPAIEAERPRPAPRPRPPSARERRKGREAVADLVGWQPLSIEYRQTRVIATPKEVFERNRIVAATGEGPAADAFRVLRAQVLSRLEACNGRALAICASTQGSGKTFVAANLAVSVARHLNRSALLVDLDLRHPSVHTQFGLEPQWGLSDYLLGRQPLEACLVNPGIDRLVLLPQARRSRNSSEVLASPQMAALAEELRGRYPERMIIYDCPPLMASDDFLVALGYADGCLLVVQEGKTRRADLRRAMEFVGEDRLLGTVLNKSRWSSASDYYYYG